MSKPKEVLDIGEARPMRILVLYHSKTGHMLEAANATADGIRSAGADAKVVAVTDFSADSIDQYDPFGGLGQSWPNPASVQIPGLR